MLLPDKDFNTKGDFYNDKDNYKVLIIILCL